MDTILVIVGVGFPLDSLKGQTLSDTGWGAWFRCLLCASVSCCSGHVHLGGGPRAEPACSGGNTSLWWPEDTSVFSLINWWQWPRREVWVSILMQTQHKRMGYVYCIFVNSEALYVSHQDIHLIFHVWQSLFGSWRSCNVEQTVAMDTISITGEGSN